MVTLQNEPTAEERIKLNIKWGVVVINPFTGVREDYDYPEGATEAQIDQINCLAQFRSDSLWRIYHAQSYMRMMEALKEENQPGLFERIIEWIKS